MFVGVGRFVLQIPDAKSLKDRRQVVRSAKERLRSRLGLSVAEVGDVERWRLATLGAAVVSREAKVCTETLAAARSILAGVNGAVLCDVATEVQSYRSGGEGIDGGIEKALDPESVEGRSFPFGSEEGAPEPEGGSNESWEEFRAHTATTHGSRKLGHER